MLKPSPIRDFAVTRLIQLQNARCLLCHEAQSVRRSIVCLFLLGTTMLAGCVRTPSSNPIDLELDALVAGGAESSARAPFISPADPNLTPLVTLGRQDISHMLKRLRDDDLRIRFYCAFALGEIGDRRASRPLIALAEEMRRSFRREEYWHSGIEGETLRALAKIRDPEISAYALQRFQCVLGAADRGDFFIWGSTYTSLLKAQGREEDIRLAVELLKNAQRTRRNDANISAALKILSSGAISSAP